MAAGESRPGVGAALVPAFAGVALFVSIFALMWFGAAESVQRGFDEARAIEEQFGTPEVVLPDLSENAWESLGALAILILVAAALCGVAMTIVSLMPRPPVPRFAMAAVTTAVGTLATAVVLYHLVNPPGDASREIGVFAGLLAAGGVAVGGWIALEDAELRSRRPSARRARGRSATRTRSRSSSG